MQHKLTKRKFIKLLSEKSRYGYKETARIYELFFDILTTELLSGSKVIFNGFGCFEIKPHKGHKIRYCSKNSCDDYYVIKFSTSNVLRRKLSNFTN